MKTLDSQTCVDYRAQVTEEKQLVMALVVQSASTNRRLYLGYLLIKHSECCTLGNCAMVDYLLRDPAGTTGPVFCKGQVESRPTSGTGCR